MHILSLETEAVLMDLMVWAFLAWKTLNAWVARIRKYFEPSRPAYYSVDSDGVQTPYDGQSCRLIVYPGPQYRFIDLGAEWADIEAEPVSMGYAAMEATVAGRTYELNASEFMVRDSDLFTPTFNKWLCRNILRIAPAPVTYTVIDASMNLEVIVDTKSK